MRALSVAFLGLALAVFAGVLTSAPVSALETLPAAPAIGAAAATPVASPRCHRWRRYCEARHPSRAYRLRACLALHGCAG
jgi:hypothetical protein